MLYIRFCSKAEEKVWEDEIALTIFPCPENTLMACGESCRELSLCFGEHRDRKK